jgi:hypothetical protein
MDLRQILAVMRELEAELAQEDLFENADKAFVAGYLMAGKVQGFIDHSFIREALQEKWEAGPNDVEQKGPQNTAAAKASSDKDSIVEPSGPPRAGQSWTDEEEAKLVRAVGDGLSIEEISALHERSEIAIIYRMEALGLKFSGSNGNSGAVPQQAPTSRMVDNRPEAISKINMLLSELNTEIEAPPGKLWEFGGDSWMKQVGNEHDRNLIKNAKFELTSELRILLRMLRDRAETDQQRKLCSRAKTWILDSGESLVAVAKVFSKSRDDSEMFAQLLSIEKILEK